MDARIVLRKAFCSSPPNRQSCDAPKGLGSLPQDIKIEDKVRTTKDGKRKPKKTHRSKRVMASLCAPSIASSIVFKNKSRT